MSYEEERQRRERANAEEPTNKGDGDGASGSADAGETKPEASTPAAAEQQDTNMDEVTIVFRPLMCHVMTLILFFLFFSCRSSVIFVIRFVCVYH